MTMLAPLLQSFFLERLQRQKQVSQHTIKAYRDTICLLLSYVKRELGKAPAALELEDIDAHLISSFLDYLENERGNGPRTRNARLAAIHSFFRYIFDKVPELASQIQCVLAIPSKRFASRVVAFLNRMEADALLDAPDKSTYLGRRDYVILLLALQTGLRLSELTALRIEDIEFGHGQHLRCHGKGRKDRCVPIIKTTAALIRNWITESQGSHGDYLFCSARGSRLSADAVEGLVRKYTRIAKVACPSLMSKRISPHVLRHTAAMRLLEAGVDRTVIALWLGHEHIETTHIYLHADLSIMERALALMNPNGEAVKRYNPSDKSLAFLEAL